MQPPVPLSRLGSPTLFQHRGNLPPTCVLGVAVSRLHALIVIARLKRKGVAAEAISALCAPGLIPDGTVIRGGGGPSFFRSDAGVPVEVVGPLQTTFSVDARKSWETGLLEMGVTPAQTQNFGEAVKFGRVLLCVESRLRSGLNVILGVLGANNVDDVVVTPFSGYRTASSAESFSLPAVA